MQIPKTQPWPSLNIQLFAEAIEGDKKTQPVATPTEIVKSTKTINADTKFTESENEITTRDKVVMDNASGVTPPTSINAGGEPPQAIDDIVKTESEPLSTEALADIELALKDIQPNEVQRFQRELSKALKVDLFNDKGASELFSKYSPEARAILDKASSVADKIQSTKTINAEQETANELLKTKIELELLKNGCPNDWLNDAVILAQSQVKSISDLSSVKGIASRYASITAVNGQVQPIRTSVAIGDGKKDLTDGERAVQYLRQKNPSGYKTNN